MKKFICYISCWLLVFNSIHYSHGLYLNNKAGLKAYSPTLSLGIQPAYAQLDSFTSTAKEKNSGFNTYYLPMLVMLGLGIMTIYMLTSMDRKTADFYVFAIGSVAYLASVLSSWLSEKKKFEALPDSLSKDTQLEAFKVQKQSFEDVHKIIERRLIFQGAATAAFAAAAIMAGVAYTKEKSLGVQSEAAFQALVKEVQSKCATIPIVNAQPPWLDAKTGVPLQASCQKNAAELATCVMKMQAHQKNLNLLDSQIMSPDGSQAANNRSIATSNQIDEKIITCLGPSLSETKNLETQATQVTQILPEEYNERLKDGIYFESNGERFVYLPPLKNERYNDPNATYMEKYFSDEELKDFTKEEISTLNNWKPDISLVDLLLISNANAQRIVSNITSVGGASSTDIDQVVTESLRSATAAVTGTEGELSDSHLLISDSVAVAATTYLEGAAVVKGAELAGKAANTAVQGVASVADDLAMKARISAQMATDSARSVASRAGMTTASGQASAAAVKVTSQSAYRQVATAGTKLVAKRAAQVAVVAAVGTLAVVSSPVTGAILTGVTVALAARDLYNITNTYLKNTTGSGLTDRLQGGLKSLKGWWSSSVNPPLRNDFDLLNFVLPTAHAFVPGISAGATKVLEGTSEKSAKEADKWIYNPKGRMVFYGAVTVLVGFITVNTLNMKKQIEADIKAIDEIIQQMPQSVEVKNQYLDLNFKKEVFRLDSILSWILPKAIASVPEAGNFPLEIPCLAPFQGKCISNRQFLQRNMLAGVKYPPIVLETAARSAKMGDMVQNRNIISSDFEAEARRLNELMPELLETHEKTKYYINELHTKKFNEKPIPFAQLEEQLSNRFLKLAENEVRSSGDGFDFKTIFGPISRMTKQFNTSKGEMEQPLEGEIENSLNMATTKESPVPSREVASNVEGEDLSYLNKEYILPNEGINTSKDSNLFEQISRRYIIWQLRN